MMKVLSYLLLLAFFNQNSFAQTSSVRRPSSGFSFIGNDYITAQRIRSTSLAAVLRDKKVASFKEMGHGLAVHYIKGFNPHIDFNASIAGSFVEIQLPGKTSSQDDFLLEIDGSANFKMFEDAVTTVNPYIIAGIGASKYTNVFGAFMPLGVGIDVNIFNEARFFTSLQYRVPVTPEANLHHFQVSFGISSFF